MVVTRLETHNGFYRYNILGVGDMAPFRLFGSHSGLGNLELVDADDFRSRDNFSDAGFRTPGAIELVLWFSTEDQFWRLLIRIAMPNPLGNRLDRYPDKKVARVCGKLVRALAKEWKLTHHEFSLFVIACEKTSNGVLTQV
jgi:hypothetical protein